MSGPQFPMLRVNYKYTEPNRLMVNLEVQSPKLNKKRDFFIHCFYSGQIIYNFINSVVYKSRCQGYKLQQHEIIDKYRRTAII